MKNKKNINTIFIGSSIYTLSALSDYTNINGIFIEECLQNDSLITFCKRKKIKYFYVTSSSDILDILIEKNLNPEIIFVTNSSIILKQSLIDKCNNIFNLHNGDLLTNRGAHPLYHSILNKDNFMFLVCHTIESEKIDAGRIVCEIKIPINYNLDFITNVDTIHNFSKIIVSHVISCYTKYGNIKGVSVKSNKNSYKKRIDNNIKQRIKQLSHLINI